MFNLLLLELKVYTQLYSHVTPLLKSHGIFHKENGIVIEYLPRARNYAKCFHILSHVYFYYDTYMILFLLVYFSI